MADTLPPTNSYFASKHVYRSEKMLIDALNRHDLELERPVPQSHATLPISPSPTPQRAHKRRHSHVPQSSRTTSRVRDLSNALPPRSPSPSDDDVEDLNEHYITPSSFLFGSTITGLPISSRSPATTSRRPSLRRKDNSSKLEGEPEHRLFCYGADAEFKCPSSPRPSLHRAAQTEINQSPTKMLNPHEQSLRARLERVLHQPRTPGSSPDSRRSRDSSGSASPPELPPGESSLSQSPSQLCSRGRPDPNSALLASDKYASKNGMAASDSSTEPLTPPPTPPATSRTPARARSPSSPHVRDPSFAHQQRRSFSRSPSHSQSQLPRKQQLSLPPTPFNAHAASRHCRAMEGYVSFSDIEGLGAPDDPDAADDEEPTHEQRRIGLGSLFRVWG